MTLRVPKVPSDSGGMLKLELPTCVSMNEPCKMNRLSIWLRMVLNIIPMIQIGNKCNTAFSSSIWVTKQSLHGFTDLFA